MFWLQLSLAVFSLFYALFVVCLLRGLYWMVQDMRARARPEPAVT